MRSKFAVRHEEEIKWKSPQMDADFCGSGARAASVLVQQECRWRRGLGDGGLLSSGHYFLQSLNLAFSQKRSTAFLHPPNNH